ncbi:MAG: HesA/MoeB/ThiF family protein [Candidatus Hydrogenedentes bacterium]|nr:HesA/MoeB/ThiF family protein [Candidatus Hydrogenedentota bacterium]
MTFTQDQLERYRRNLLVPGVGEAGQERLARARVCVVGLGGLGSAAAWYLTAAGVGALGLLDADVVELSNLQRQIVHSTPRLGQAKAESAAVSLAALNPDVRLEPQIVRVSTANAAELLGAYDLVVDATDSFEAKFMLNDTCLDLRKPLATAGIRELSGQAMLVVPGATACLRCAIPAPEEDAPADDESGVLGPVPGILGSIQALEAVRWLVGLWRPAPDGAGRLHSVDGGAMRLRTVSIPRRAGCRCAAVWSE